MTGQINTNLQNSSNEQLEEEIECLSNEVAGIQSTVDANSTKINELDDKVDALSTCVATDSVCAVGIKATNVEAAKTTSTCVTADAAIITKLSATNIEAGTITGTLNGNVSAGTVTSNCVVGVNVCASNKIAAPAAELTNIDGVTATFTKGDISAIDAGSITVDDKLTSNCITANNADITNCLTVGKVDAKDVDTDEVKATSVEATDINVTNVTAAEISSTNANVTAIDAANADIDNLTVNCTLTLADGITLPSELGDTTISKVTTECLVVDGDTQLNGAVTAGSITVGDGAVTAGEVCIGCKGAVIDKDKNIDACCVTATKVTANTVCALNGNSCFDQMYVSTECVCNSFPTNLYPTNITIEKNPSSFSYTRLLDLDDNGPIADTLVVKPSEACVSTNCFYNACHICKGMFEDAVWLDNYISDCHKQSVTPFEGGFCTNHDITLATCSCDNGTPVAGFKLSNTDPENLELSSVAGCSLVGLGCDNVDVNSTCLNIDSSTVTLPNVAVCTVQDENNVLKVDANGQVYKGLAPNYKPNYYCSGKRSSCLVDIDSCGNVIRYDNRMDGCQVDDCCILCLGYGGYRFKNENASSCFDSINNGSYAYVLGCVASGTDCNLYYDYTNACCSALCIGTKNPRCCTAKFFENIQCYNGYNKLLTFECVCNTRCCICTINNLQKFDLCGCCPILCRYVYDGTSAGDKGSFSVRLFNKCLQICNKDTEIFKIQDGKIYTECGEFTGGSYFNDSTFTSDCLVGTRCIVDTTVSTCISEPLTNTTNGCNYYTFENTTPKSITIGTGYDCYCKCELLTQNCRCFVFPYTNCSIETYSHGDGAPYICVNCKWGNCTKTECFNIISRCYNSCMSCSGDGYSCYENILGNDSFCCLCRFCMCNYGEYTKQENYTSNSTEDTCASTFERQCLNFCTNESCIECREIYNVNKDDVCSHWSRRVVCCNYNVCYYCDDSSICCNIDEGPYVILRENITSAAPENEFCCVGTYCYNICPFTFSYKQGNGCIYGCCYEYDSGSWETFYEYCPSDYCESFYQRNYDGSVLRGCCWCSTTQCYCKFETCDCVNFDNNSFDSYYCVNTSCISTKKKIATNTIECLPITNTLVPLAGTVNGNGFAFFCKGSDGTKFYDGNFAVVDAGTATDVTYLVTVGA